MPNGFPYYGKRATGSDTFSTPTFIPIVLIRSIFTKSGLRKISYNGPGGPGSRSSVGSNSGNRNVSASGNAVINLPSGSGPPFPLRKKPKP